VRSDQARSAVTSAFPLLGDISRFHEVRDDPLCGTFRDPHGVGDVPQPHRRVPVQAEEYLGMAREELPAVPEVGPAGWIGLERRGPLPRLLRGYTTPVWPVLSRP
jgi:hypothetical protein